MKNILYWFDNRIYKLFYDLLLLPNENEWNIFWNSLRNLEYGAGNIILIWEYICKEFNVGALDLFFIITLSENRERLNKLLKNKYKFIILESHENILKKISIYIKIKNNYKIGKKEVLDYFLNSVSKNQNMEETDENKENSKEDSNNEIKSQIKVLNKE